MAKIHRRDPSPQMQAESQPDAGSEADYSYTQWRRARMRQLERNYAAQCEQEPRVS